LIDDSRVSNAEVRACGTLRGVSKKRSIDEILQGHLVSAAELRALWTFEKVPRIRECVIDILDNFGECAKEKVKDPPWNFSKLVSAARKVFADHGPLFKMNSNQDMLKHLVDVTILQVQPYDLVDFKPKDESFILQLKPQRVFVKIGLGLFGTSFMTKKQAKDDSLVYYEDAKDQTEASEDTSHFIANLKEYSETSDCKSAFEGFKVYSLARSKTLADYYDLSHPKTHDELDQAMKKHEQHLAQVNLLKAKRVHEQRLDKPDDRQPAKK
jgi:hypothetical protein